MMHDDCYGDDMIVKKIYEAFCDAHLLNPDERKDGDDGIISLIPPYISLS